MRIYDERIEDRPSQDATEPKNTLRRTAISGIAFAVGMTAVITGVGANAKGLKANQDEKAIDLAPKTYQPIVVNSCPPGGRAMTLGAGVIAETYGTKGIGIDIIVIGDGAKTPVLAYGDSNNPDAWCGPLSDKLNYKTNNYTPDPRHADTVNMLIPGWGDLCGASALKSAKEDCDLAPQVFRNLGALVAGGVTA